MMGDPLLVISQSGVSALSSVAGDSRSAEALGEGGTLGKAPALSRRR